MLGNPTGRGVLRAARAWNGYGGGFENHSIALIACDDAVELSELFRTADRHAQFFDLEGSRVVDDVAVYCGLRMITGEAIIRIHRRGNVIDHVAGRNRDFKSVRIARRFLELDRKPARFSSLEQSRSFVPNHAGSHQEQVPRSLGIVRRLKGVVETKR